MSTKETSVGKKRGPKPSGIEKVVYYRRVLREDVERLDAVLRGGSVVKEEDGLQVKALLADIERLHAEVEDLKARRENWTRATDDQKTRFWINKYEEIKRRLLAIEGSSSEHDWV